VIPVARYAHKLIHVRVEAGVATCTFDNPPINLLDVPLMAELETLETELETDDDVRVVVFDSADPDFYLAHFDVANLLSRCGTVQAPLASLKRLHAVLERYRLMPKATIGLIEGATRGGGSEFALALDMRFAAIGRAIFGQPEVALGLIPGGSGTQRLARFAGRGRALEIVLGCEAFDAQLAERYGWINRAFPPDELRPFVTRLAARIATFPPAAVVRAKRGVDAGMPDVHAGLMQEADLFSACLGDPAVERRLRDFMAGGGQTREFELKFEQALEQHVTSKR
jgi:enoyl-CoA hydratase/carnithine racemase